MALTNTQIVTNDYADILFDTTNHANDITNYAGLLSLGIYTPSQVATAIATSAEANIVNYVYSLYTAILGTSNMGSSANIAGLKYWVQQVEGGQSGLGMTAANIANGTLTQAAINFLDQSFINAAPAASPLAVAATTPSSASAQVLVAQLYAQALNNTSPAQSGVTYWVNQYNAWVASNGATAALQSLVNSFANSAAGVNAAGISTMLANAALSDTGSGATYVPPTTGTPGTTFTLTTGVDTITGGSNNLVNGTETTITGLDSIAFTGSGNTFNVSDAAGATADLTKISVSGVQTLNLNSATSLKAAAADVSAWTGLTTANFTLHNVAADQAITAAATTAVNLTETITAAAATTVTGGSAVAITAANGGTANAAKTITVTGVAGTSSASVTQTFTTGGTDAAVEIDDATNASTTKAGTITSVTVDGLNGAVATIKDNSLSNLTVNNVASATTVTVTDNATYAATTPTTTLNLSLNNDTGLTLVDTNSEYTTLAITTGAKASTVAAFTTFSGVTALTEAGSSVLTVTSAAGLSNLKTVSISGAAGLTADLSGLANLTSVTSASSGTVTLTLDGTKETFTGGSGQDVITIGAAATKAITGGPATNNELVWDAAAATTFGTVSGFTTLGVNAAVGTFAGSSGTFDMSKLTGFTAFDVLGTTTGAVTFTKVTAGAALSIEATDTAAVTYQTADTAGATDSITLTLGNSTTSGATGLTAASVTLEDSVFNGIGNVTLVSTDSTAASVNAITAFSDASLSTLTVQGNSGVTLGAFNDGAASLTINGNSTGTGGIALAGLTGSSATALTSLTVTGSDAVTITALTETGTSFTLNDSASANVTITTLTDTSATTESFTNSGTKTLAVTSVDTALTTLNLTGKVTYTNTSDLATGGVTINGSSDNAVVTFTNGATASGKTDNITLGNGANVITDAAANAASTANISVGTGANSITVGGQTANITLGTHTALTGADTITVGANGSVSVLTTITGAVAGDHIVFGGDALAAGTPTQVTAAMVAADTTHAGNTTLLSNWVAAALDSAGNGGAALAAHGVAWFNFQGNTYFVESVAGGAIDAGSVVAADTVVKLVGTYAEANIGALAGHAVTLV